MTKGSGFSIFMMSTGDVYERYKQIINQLSDKYEAPKFEPHVTLISRLELSENELLSKISELADILRPFEINLTTAEYLDEYFRCVFILAEKTNIIMKANMEARKIFGRLHDPPYMPHLSLLYGDFDEKTKKKIIEELGDVSGSFEVNSIFLFSTEGEVKDWYKVKEFPLH